MSCVTDVLFRWEWISTGLTSVSLVRRCVDSHITWQAKASCAWLMWRPGELMNTKVMSQRCSVSEMPQIWPIDVWVVVFWHQPHDATRLQHFQPPRLHRAGPGSTTARLCGAVLKGDRRGPGCGRGCEPGAGPLLRKSCFKLTTTLQC